MTAVLGRSQEKSYVGERVMVTAVLGRSQEKSYVGERVMVTAVLGRSQEKSYVGERVMVTAVLGRSLVDRIKYGLTKMRKIGLLGGDWSATQKLEKMRTKKKKMIFKRSNI